MANNTFRSLLKFLDGGCRVLAVSHEQIGLKLLQLLTTTNGSQARWNFGRARRLGILVGGQTVYASHFE